MTKYTFILLGLCVFFIGSTTKKKKKESPNVVFILVDDLGWRDLACQGSKSYQTPNIDQLFSESYVFQNAYSAHPRCLPSRYGLMTGNYPAIGGVPAKRSKLLPDEKTLGHLFKNSGYASCYIGKWHLGGNKLKPDGMGFDTCIAAGKAGSTRNYFAPYNRTNNKPWNKKKAPILDFENATEGEYLTDRLTDEAVKYIEEKKDEQFFLMLAHYAVHQPLQAPKDLTTKYDSIFKKTFNGTQAEYIKEGTGRTKLLQNHPKYAAMIENLDQNVGKIIQKLKANQLYNNTIIVFTSDHGGLSNDGYNNRDLATSNMPLRAGKGWLYEGGIRVPLAICWPNKIKPKNDNKNIVHGIDFYPTLAELVGIKTKVEGVSFLPLVYNQKEQLKEQPVFWYGPKARPHSTGEENAIAMRLGNYKLIKWYKDKKVELFNLKNDIGEQNDLSSQEPQTKERLLKILEKWEDKNNL